MTTTPLLLDIFTVIVDIFDANSEYEAMAAMCSTHSSLWKMYIKKRFKRVKFNLRRRDIIPRLSTFSSLLNSSYSSSHIASAVREVIITDHCLTEEMEDNEAQRPFHDEGEQVLFSHGDMITNVHGQRYLLLLSANNLSTDFASVLRGLNNLNSFTLSFIYRQIDFNTFTPLMRKEICRMVALPTLTDIHLLGLAEVPFQLLERFTSLQNLSLKTCTFATGNEESLSDIAESRMHAPPRLSPIRKVTVQNIHPNDGLRLLNLWNGSFPVTISNIQHIRIVFCRPQDVGIARVLMHYGKETVTKLELHTLSLQLPHQGVLYPTYKCFNPEWMIQPGDIRQLTHLEDLTISVADWHTEIMDPRQQVGNDELKWALRTFQAANSATLRRVKLRIKVGGWNQNGDLDALIDFEHRLHNGLMDEWITELRKEKWQYLESFWIYLLFPSMESLDLSPIVDIAPIGTTDEDIVCSYRSQVWSGVFDSISPVYSDPDALDMQVVDYKVYLSTVTRAGLVTEVEPMMFGPGDYNMDVDSGE